MEGHHENINVSTSTLPPPPPVLILNDAAMRHPVGFDEIDHRMVEGGGLRSTWSPDHEFENDIPYQSFSERLSKRLSSFSVTSVSSIAKNPEFWNRLRPRQKVFVPWKQSFRALATYSWLNYMLIFLPCAWAVGFSEKLPKLVQFALSFLAVIPLCKIVQFAGENMALYVGKDFGDLIEITLSNAIEAILGLSLLMRCELKLLQATIIGVVLLRLLFIPGMSFIVGGSQVAAQELHPHLIDLNQSLLFTSVLFLMLPVSFFSALGQTNAATAGDNVVSDTMRGELLKISRGMAILLIGVYICSRFFIHGPLGHEHGLSERDDAPEELRKHVAHMAQEEPEMNVYVCIIAMVVGVGLLAVTAELLVDGIQVVKQSIAIREEFLGLILLPLASFSGDGLLAVGYFISRFFKHKPSAPPMLADYRPIESSIQFILLWTPILVCLGWFYHKPMSLLFDLFEISILLGACFLVNYVCADSKTNWAEGVMLVALFVMIALTTWFYPGQPEIQAMLQCGSVESYVATAPPLFLTLPPKANTSAAIPKRSHSKRDLALMSEKLEEMLALYNVLVATNEDL